MAWVGILFKALSWWRYWLPVLLLWASWSWVTSLQNEARDANARADTAERLQTALLLRMKTQSDAAATKRYRNERLVKRAQDALDRINSGQVAYETTVETVVKKIRVSDYIAQSCGVRDTTPVRSDRAAGAPAQDSDDSKLAGVRLDAQAIDRIIDGIRDRYETHRAQINELKTLRGVPVVIDVKEYQWLNQ